MFFIEPEIFYSFKNRENKNIDQSILICSSKTQPKIKTSSAIYLYMHVLDEFVCTRYMFKFIYLLLILCHFAQSCWLLYRNIRPNTAFSVDDDECDWLMLFAFNAIIMLLNIDKDLSEIKLIPLD